jgi:hypothetical protein
MKASESLRQPDLFAPAEEKQKFFGTTLPD